MGAHATGLSKSKTVAVTAAIGTTAEVDYRPFRSGTIHVPSGTALTTLTFSTAEKPGGTYEPAYDSAGTPAAVTQAVAADRSFPLPVALLGCGAFKMVGNDAGDVKISLKS